MSVKGSDGEKQVVWGRGLLDAVSRCVGLRVVSGKVRDRGVVSMRGTEETGRHWGDDGWCCSDAGYG